ncbi:hypothetical protein DPMN_007695 [Dreissena polymorpha]|uniref:Uncharacterized protein n=1 Tax=Dreissena polymorpha TaxID=45954 RepID=A0A9D4MU21_DREPO|nr:hypothetical protein DPMN_007695 [Dreissena polymorpha]
MENLPIDATLDDVMRKLGYYSGNNSSKETCFTEVEENQHCYYGKRLKRGIGRMLSRKKLSFKRNLFTTNDEATNKNKIQRKVSTGTLKSSDTGYEPSTHLKDKKNSSPNRCGNEARTTYSRMRTTRCDGRSWSSNRTNERGTEENLNKTMRLKRLKPRTVSGVKQHYYRQKPQRLSRRRYRDSGSELYPQNTDIDHEVEDETTGKCFILEKFLNDQVSKATTLQRPPTSSRLSEQLPRPRANRSKTNLTGSKEFSLESERAQVVPLYRFDMNGTLCNLMKAQRRHKTLRRENGVGDLKTSPHPKVSGISGKSADPSVSWMLAVSFDCSLVKPYDLLNRGFACTLTDSESEGNDFIDSTCWDMTDVIDESVGSLMTSKSDLEHDLLDVTFCDKYLFHPLNISYMKPVGEGLIFKSTTR